MLVDLLVTARTQIPLSQRRRISNARGLNSNTTTLTLKKDVIAFVYAPSLSKPDFEEKGDISERAEKRGLI